MFRAELETITDTNAPTSRWGLELQKPFIGLGYALFGDAAQPPASFIAADLLDESNLDVAALVGTIDIIHLGMVLHIWGLEGQIRACARVVKLLRPQPGALILGQSVGHVQGLGSRIYRHSAETFKQMWDEVGRLTGTRWECRARLEVETAVGNQTSDWDDPLRRRLVFEVERLE